MWPNSPVVMPVFQYPGMLSADMPEKVFPKKSPPPKFDFWEKPSNTFRLKTMTRNTLLTIVRQKYKITMHSFSNAAD